MIIVIKEKKRVVLAVTVRDYRNMFAEEDYCDEENIPVKVARKRIYAMLPGNISDIYLNFDDITNDEEPTDENTTIGGHIEVLKGIYRIVNNLEKDDHCNGINLGTSLTIIENGRVYDINPSLRFKEVTDYVVHGYGTDCEIVRTVLEKTKEEPAKKRIREAITMVDKVTTRKFFPLIVMDNKKFKPEIWRE